MAPFNLGWHVGRLLGASRQAGPESGRLRDWICEQAAVGAVLAGSWSVRSGGAIVQTSSPRVMARGLPDLRNRFGVLPATLRTSCSRPDAKPLREPPGAACCLQRSRLAESGPHRYDTHVHFLAARLETVQT